MGEVDSICRHFGSRGFPRADKVRSRQCSRRWVAADVRIRGRVHTVGIVLPNPHVQLVGRERRTAPIRNSFVLEDLVAECRRRIVGGVPRRGRNHERNGDELEITILSRLVDEQFWL